MYVVLGIGKREAGSGKRGKQGQFLKGHVRRLC
jgi:hypothetical protein